MMKSTSIISRFRQCLIVFVLILGLQPQTLTLAQPASTTGNRPTPLTRSPSPLASSGCQWSYYPIFGGSLHAEQPLFNDPDNTPVINLSVGNMFKGKAP